MSDKPLVIVLSRNSSTGLSVIRSLGHAGYTVDLIASSFREGASRVAASSRYVRNAVEVVSGKVGDEGEAELLAEILKYVGCCEERPVLFPTDDYTTSVMDNNRDVLEEHFLMPFIEGGSKGDLARLMDKTAQCRIAEEVGLNVPLTRLVSLREEELMLPEELVYPAYVKPVKSILGYKTEMAVCEDEASLRFHLLELRDRYSDRDVIVQEYLRIDQEIETSGACIGGEVFLDAMIRKTRVGVHNTGVTLTGTLAPFEELGSDVREKAFELLRRFGYNGCFGMEFNIVGDKIYFNEVNLRSAGENYAYFHSNVNVPLIFVESLQGIEHHPEEMDFRGFGKQMIYDKVAWDDYIYGYITREELDECISSSDYAILCGDEDDPEPERVFLEECESKRERVVSREKNRKRRERCIEHAMKTAGWTREQAEEQIADARERLGVTYNEYRKNNFCLLNEEQQEAAYRALEERKAAKSAATDDGKPLVVVLSRIYSTGLAVVRSLGAAGYTVDLVANCRKEGQSGVTGASRYVRNYVEVVSRKVAGGGDRAILKELLEYRNSEADRIVLFPTDDYTASVMDSFRDELKDIFIMPWIVGGKQGDMVNLMRKTVQSTLAREAGLLVPKEWIVSLRDEVSIPEDVVYPCFCKPVESITGFKVEMRKCEDSEELRKHLLWLRSRQSDRDVLVQEYLEIENELDMSGVCLGQKVIIPAIIRKTMVAQYEKGVTLAGVVRPFEELDEELRDKLVRLMQSFSYFGMFDLELNVVKGKIYFNEVNLRSGGPNFAYFMSGVNLPVLVVRELTGEGHTPKDEKVREYGRSFIYEKVAWDDYANNMISKRKLKSLLSSADIRLLEYEEDPKPTELFYENTMERAERIRRRKRKEALKNNLRPYLGSISQRVKGYPQSRLSNRRNPKAETPRVLVAGRNFCSNLCMAKSLGEAGYEVEVLRVFQRKPGKYNILRKLMPEMHSRYVKAFYMINTKRNSVRLVERLKRIADEDNRMLIIPADDLVANIIDEYYDDLKDYYILPNIGGEGGEIARLMSKEAQKELAREAGLPVLNSCVISSKDESLTIPDSVTYPCFIKPNVSKNSSKSKMKRCDSKEELQDTLEERAPLGFELLVEDYVEIKRELSYLGVSTSDGVVCPGYFEAVEGGEGKHRGVALVGRMLPVEEAEPLMSKVVEFIESLDFNGLFDVDLIETTDGRIYFVELNLRYGASGYALTRCGANMPAMFADYMLKNIPVDKSCRIDEPYRTFASEKVLIDEYIEGILTLEDVNRIESEVDIHFIMDENDPKPYRHYRKNYRFAKKLREYNEEKARLNQLAELEKASEGFTE